MPAERGDLRQRYAYAEQCDTYTKHVPRRELDSLHAAALLGQEVHRHPEQQRKQHHRRMVVLGEEGRGGRDDEAGEQTRNHGPDSIQAGSNHSPSASTGFIAPDGIARARRKSAR